MRTATIITALMAAAVRCLPVDQQDSMGGIIGSACVDENFGLPCLELLMSASAECMWATNRVFPDSNVISSLRVSGNQTCAFYQNKDCVRGIDEKVMVVQGPWSIDALPKQIDNSIQSYICGDVAPLAPGTVIINGLEEATAPSTANGLETRDSTSAALVPPPRNDGRGCTLWKQQEFMGGDIGILPSSCGNLDKAPGNWDLQTRSLAIEPGYKCTFWTEHNCPANSPNRFEGGSKAELKAVGKLPAQFDQRINSVYCKSI